jgi:hypothetical protein
MVNSIVFGAFYEWYLIDRDEKPSKETLESAKIFWKQLNDSLKERPFKNGQHYGDCMKIPMTCTRCFIERFEKLAKLVYYDHHSRYHDVEEFYKD